MSKRPQLLAPDLSSSADNHARPRRTDPDDQRFANAASLETHETLMRRIESGAVRVVNTDTAPTATPVQNAVPRSPEVALSTKVPEYVLQKLRHRHADTGVTIRNQILLALRSQGFDIKEEDLRDERKRPRR